MKSRRNGREWCAVLRAMQTTGSRRLWLGGASLALLTVLMGMALLGLSGWFITAAAMAGLVPAVALVFDVFMPSAGIRLLAIGRTGSRYAERLVTHDATLAALAALRVRLFRAWSRPQAAHWLLQRPARLLQRLTADVDALDNIYLRWIVPAFAALGAVVLLALGLSLMTWWIGVLAGLWLLGAGWGIAIWQASRTRKAAIRRAMGTERLRAQTVDMVAGKTELLMAGRLQAQCDAIMAADKRAAKADAELFGVEARATIAYGIASALTLCGVLLAMAWLVEVQRIGAAVAAFGVLLALSAMEPFAALRRGATEAGRTLLAVRRLGAVLNDEPPLENSNLHVRQPEAGFSVQLNSASAAYERHHAIGPLNLELRHGERVALIGASGSGKTTLLSLVAGEIEASAGHVAALSGSWMTQRTELFRDSVRDNLLLASPHANDQNLWNALDAAGLGSDIRVLPQGLDTQLGEGGLGLSGGQARRLALARLMLSAADCWLLDEATEGLDADVANDVLKRLWDASEGRTLVLATHWRREAEMTDRVIWMEQGRIAGQALSGTKEFAQALGRLRANAASYVLHATDHNTL
ncbi:thiol reductant ABC exporter subunit CydC [Diaphorobacter sp. HDW4A]|uniref:thiol reductant ABC exporter subunit CydC n=1 Tax=Diaphorobacter sp. HDW4A TaxID=2714924 RepID=UPI001408233A|nr:thiol reductant ABC exporter subunit CydC [Diaphorobacter sp. HDW4A]QIL79151.1 thiol reductant ABC exporter subunit CydC [Diaphorobacter sp. HDW4A]